MKLLSSILYFCSFHCFGQHSIYTELRSVGSYSMGRTGVSVWKGSYASANPAQLAFIKSPEYSFQIKNYYSLKNLNTLGVLAQWPVEQNSGLAAGLTFDGGSHYHESLLQFYYGRKIGHSTGIGIGLLGQNIKSSLKASSLSLKWCFGLQTTIAEYWRLGFVFYNPFQAFTTTKANSSFYSALGINYQIYNNLHSLFEIHKEGFLPMAAGIGLIYWPGNQFDLKLGYHTRGPKFSLGSQIKISNAGFIQIGFEFHFILGLSPAFGYHWTID